MRRRTVLKGLAATATALCAGPLIITERTIAQTRTIYVNTWGGSWTVAEEAAFFKPFTDQTGIRVRTVAPVSSTVPRRFSRTVTRTRPASTAGGGPSSYFVALVYARRS